MKNDENKVVSHPLCVNFKTLAQYDMNKINIEEIVFFEWLNVKRLSFGDDEFFYSNDRVIDELGIKRYRLAGIKKKLQQLGLVIEQKGNNNTSHYLVTPEFIETCVNEYVHTEYRRSTLQQLLNLDFKNDIKVSKVKKTKIEKFIKNELQVTYNSRRRNSETCNNGKQRLLQSGLSYNKKTVQQLSLLMNRYSNNIIMNSFICFADMIISGEDECKHILNNFSSYNRADDSFPIFENRLNRYNSEYAQVNDFSDY